MNTSTELYSAMGACVFSILSGFFGDKPPTTEQGLATQVVLSEMQSHTYPPALLPAVMAVAAVESAYRFDARSPVGAVGLMQMTPIAYRDLKDYIVHTREEYKWYHKAPSVCAPGIWETVPWSSIERSPSVNVAAGACFLWKQLIHYEGDLPKALAHYNGGSRGVRNYLAGRDGETLQYVGKVTGLLDTPQCGNFYRLVNQPDAVEGGE